MASSTEEQFRNTQEGADPRAIVACVMSAVVQLYEAQDPLLPGLNYGDIRRSVHRRRFSVDWVSHLYLPEPQS